MILRKWQSEAKEKAITNFLDGNKHFLGLATPGSGKTTFASALSKELYIRKEVDLVIVFSPSTIVANDFNASLSSMFNARFDGKLGAVGHSLTYQSLKYLDDQFWQLFNEYNVFVIFDEVHHCAGSNVENANAWGEQILTKIQHKAKYTLALTGTPWRSDAIPIVLSQYCTKSLSIQCDYTYGLQSAITDRVCRMPTIIALDNDHISISSNTNESSYNSFKELLSASVVPYSDIIHNDFLIEQLLIKANIQLNRIRLSNSSAGGLVVAASVSHARHIRDILQNTLGETATLVTCKEDNAADIINTFRRSSEKWIISVGMISEGTNIPRLQVCCHLTNIKTEMHFKQILGRILRHTSSGNEDAILLMPAEPKLLEYAYRIEKDIPEEASIVRIESQDLSINISSSTTDSDNSDNAKNIEERVEILLGRNNIENKELNLNPLAQSYENIVGILGRFKEEFISPQLLK
jgi:superfamily II DNA or RNA helicase